MIQKHHMTRFEIFRRFFLYSHGAACFGGPFISAIAFGQGTDSVSEVAARHALAMLLQHPEPSHLTGGIEVWPVSTSFITYRV